MATLRKKLDKAKDPYIQTHIGIGYRMFKVDKKGCEICADPKKLDQKSNFWRSVFLWQNTLLSLRKK